MAGAWRQGGRIVEVQEEGVSRPRPVYEEYSMARTADMKAVQTPIEVGTLDITSRVQLVAEIEAGGL